MSAMLQTLLARLYRQQHDYRLLFCPIENASVTVKSVIRMCVDFFGFLS